MFLISYDLANSHPVHLYASSGPRDYEVPSPRVRFNTNKTWTPLLGIADRLEESIVSPQPGEVDSD